MSKLEQTQQKRQSGDDLGPSKAGSAEKLQFKQKLAGLPISDQVQALRPPAPMGMSSNAPVQAAMVQGSGASERSPGSVHQAASRGVSGGGGQLPYLGAIQKSFGGHDVSSVQAHTDENARKGCSQMGAKAFTTGNHIAFGSSKADIHTAAHEAAHVVQQRAGVQLSGGVGQVGDKYEQHADAVANHVVQGKNAEPLLDQFAGGGAGDSVQKAEDDNEESKKRIATRRKKSDGIQGDTADGGQVQGKFVQMEPLTGVALYAAYAGIVSASVGTVATIGGAVSNAQRDTTGTAADLKLEFEKAYLMSSSAENQLVQIGTVLHHIFLDKINAPGGGHEDDTDEQKDTIAMGNARTKIEGVLRSRSYLDLHQTAVANGAGGSSRSTPYGVAVTTMEGGGANRGHFDCEGTTIQTTAREHGISLTGDAFHWITRCKIEFEAHANTCALWWDDDIYVRGQTLDYGPDGFNLKVEAKVAFDWDGDTTYYEWKDRFGTAMQPWRIPAPHWTGPSNPDD